MTTNNYGAINKAQEIGSAPYGFRDHLDMLWISFKSRLGGCTCLQVTRDEQQEKNIYDTTRKVIKAATQCWSICQENLGENIGRERIVKRYINEDPRCKNIKKEIEEGYKELQKLIGQKATTELLKKFPDRAAGGFFRQHVIDAIGTSINS